MNIEKDTRSVCPQCLRPLPARLVQRDGALFLERTCPEHGPASALVWQGDMASADAWATGTDEAGTSCCGGDAVADEAACCGGDAAETCCGAPVETSTCCGTEAVEACCGAEAVEACCDAEADTACCEAPAEQTECCPASTCCDTTEAPPPSERCPLDCITCQGHLTRPCCVLIEVTQRCNLGCPVCFAQSLVEDGADPSLDVIAGWYDAVREQAGSANIQLSGGEPTLRDDLPQIIELGRQKGFTYFQINTNGLRLASQPGYARQLKDAGASCVFLQFDGVTDDVYGVLRGRPLLDIKTRAIENCAEAGLPVVLVPTVVAGVNDAQLGQIVAFGVGHAPTVRGVHIQPLARMGRVPCSFDAPGADGCGCRTPQASSGRITIPGVLDALERQTAGMVASAHFTGGSVESPHCSFSASYRIEGDALVHVPASAPSCCGAIEADGGVQRARTANALRWGTNLDELGQPAQPGSLDEFLQQSRRSAFSITGMAFMDAQTLDLQRLQRCYIFITGKTGRLIPFCAYNLTAQDGRAPYRAG